MFSLKKQSAVKNSKQQACANISVSSTSGPTFQGFFFFLNSVITFKRQDFFFYFLIFLAEALTI